MGKKFFRLLSFLTILVALTGCTLFQSKTTSGKLLVSIEIPREILAQSVRGIEDEIAVDQVKIVIAKDTKDQTKIVPIVNGQAQTLFENLELGTWTVTATAQKEGEGGQTNDIFYGQGEGVVTLKTVTKVPIVFKLLPGDILVHITTPNDFDFDTGRAILAITADDLTVAVKEFQRGEAVKFENLTSRNYKVDIVLFKEEIEVSKATNSTIAYPGRETNLTVTFNYASLNVINDQWIMPPEKLAWVNCESIPSGLHLAWDISNQLGVATYFNVARSDTPDGKKILLTTEPQDYPGFFDRLSVQGDYYYFIASYSKQGISNGWSGPFKLTYRDNLGFSGYAKRYLTFYNIVTEGDYSYQESDILAELTRKTNENLEAGQYTEFVFSPNDTAPTTYGIMKTESGYYFCDPQTKALGQKIMNLEPIVGDTILSIYPIWEEGKTLVINQVINNSEGTYYRAALKENYTGDQGESIAVDYFYVVHKYTGISMMEKKTLIQYPDSSTKEIREMFYLSGFIY